MFLNIVYETFIKWTKNKTQTLITTNINTNQLKIVYK